MLFKQNRALCSIIGGAISFAICGNARAAPPVEKPSCERSDEFKVVDLSTPVTKLIATNGKSGLDALHDFRVTTIFRYYDLPHESIPCKTLLTDEVDAILAKHFSIGVVFQHNSDDPATFVDPDTAEAHAQRALELAAANGQERHSAIYFGVDGADLHLIGLLEEGSQRGGKPVPDQEIKKLRNAKKRQALRYNAFLKYRDEAFGANATITAESLYPHVKRYFDTVRAVFHRYAQSHPSHDYKIGMYCTAGVCDYALKNSLADYYWVAAEGRTNPEYATFVDQNRWSLLQQRETRCDKWRSKGVSFDFNRVRPQADFGAWSIKQEVIPVARPETCRAR